LLACLPALLHPHHHHHMRRSSQQQTSSYAAAQSSKEKEEIGWVCLKKMGKKMLTEKRRIWKGKQRQANTEKRRKRSRTTFGKVKNLNGPSSSSSKSSSVCDFSAFSLYSLVSESTFPKLRRIWLCDAKLITGKDSIRKNGL
jgi:hypothetical protein